MRICLVIIFLFFSQVYFCQEKITVFKNTLKSSDLELKEALPIVNTENDDIAFFLTDAKHIYGYRLNSQFKQKDNLLSVEKKRKYKVLLGSNIYDNDNYCVFLTNKKHKKYGTLQFSFSTGASTFKEFKIDKEEYFLQAVTHKNQFYLITIAGFSNYNTSGIGLFIYAFDKAGNPKKTEINTTGLLCDDEDGQSVPCIDLLYDYEDIKKIKDNVPISVEIAAEPAKMYQRDNQIIFSLDVNDKYTEMLMINLDDFKATSTSFNKPLQENTSSSKKTNSFLNGDKLLMLAATKERLELHVNDFKKERLLASFNVRKNDSITFKNSPIITEKEDFFGNYSEFEKTKRFLRRITRHKLGVSSVKIDNTYQVTIGGYELVENQDPLTTQPFNVGIPILFLDGVTVFFNPIHYAFKSYSHTQATRIECVFDEDFNHIKGQLSKNVFDKIKDNRGYSDEATTVFKYKGYYIYGRYNKYDKMYSLYKFED